MSEFLRLRTHREEILTAVRQALQSYNYPINDHRHYFFVKLGKIHCVVEYLLSGLTATGRDATGNIGQCSRLTLKSTVRSALQYLVRCGEVEEWESTGKGAPAQWCWVEGSRARYKLVARRLQRALEEADIAKEEHSMYSLRNDYGLRHTPEVMVYEIASDFGKAYGAALAELERLTA